MWLILKGFKEKPHMATFRMGRSSHLQERRGAAGEKGEGYISASSLTNSHEPNRMWGQRAPAPVAARPSSVCVSGCVRRCEREKNRESERLYMKNGLVKINKYLPIGSTGAHNSRVLFFCSFHIKSDNVEALPKTYEQSSELITTGQAEHRLVLHPPFPSHYCSNSNDAAPLVNMGRLKAHGSMVQPGGRN